MRNLWPIQPLASDPPKDVKPGWKSRLTSYTSLMLPLVGQQDETKRVSLSTLMDQRVFWIQTKRIENHNGLTSLDGKHYLFEQFI